MNAPSKKEQIQSQPRSLVKRFLFSLAWGTLALTLGAAIWGWIVYASGNAYSIVAILIGMAVAAAVLLPLRPIHKGAALLTLPAAIIAALLSIFSGEMLYVTLVFVGDSQAAFSKALSVTGNNLGIILSSPNTINSAILVLIGCVAGFFSIWRQL